MTVSMILRHSASSYTSEKVPSRNLSPLRGRLEGHGMIENDFRLGEATGFGNFGHRERTDWPSLDDRLKRAKPLGGSSPDGGTD